MLFTDEYTTELQRIDASNKGIQRLSYFLDTAAQWHAMFQKDPQATASPHAPAPLVVVLGHGVPDQPIYACGTAPIHLLGGSHASCEWSDDTMPRDADPASRSIFGYALRLAERSDIDPLFVVPTANDNLRKIAYLLVREGHAVHAFDIPPEVTSEAAQHSWERAVYELVQSVQHHVGRRSSRRSILKADQLVGMARAAMLEFEQTCSECEGVLDDQGRLLVLNTYHMTGDLAQWSAALTELCAELQARHQAIGSPAAYKPHVLVMGSPILFPQFKVATLIRDAGLSLAATADATSTTRFANLSRTERRGTTQKLLRTIARKHYVFDSSTAHVVNQAMEQYVEFLLSSTPVDGIICHILKGQIEYDFLLARMEPLFERYDIPVFRLETDYQYQDVEQLRIRLEAFAEMLEQRAFVASELVARRRCA